MKKFALILGVCLLFGANARADICYDVNDKVATTAVNIIQSQKEIYTYCSICPDAKLETVSVNNVTKGNPVYVNGVALDLAHTYYQNGGKFVNLGIASGCIKAGEYNIATELESFDTHIKEKNKIKDLKQKLIKCSDIYEEQEQKCSAFLGLQCYNHLMQAHRDVRQCYKQIAIELFNKFYGLPENDAERKYDIFQKFMYDKYLFIYTENNYCKKNNCGVSVYLYTEYATTQGLYNYIDKIISYVSHQ